ncbi:MAG: DUF4388 domain-containing protein [Chloroflexota bacterium]|nr:DUF4388 domain-containing protein [Anaerolineales bacterium]MCA9976519.1 DUF4388 domain-containing protein [Anaerolineales bacterium]MCB8968490.1 DUF4388 domain-containing protein [Ardenticatenaceae bacterium]
MALHGNLSEMSVADLIQHYGQNQKTTHILIRHHNQEANLFFQQGKVMHATLGNEQGEGVIYHILTWEDGLFSIEADVNPPAMTIDRSWSGLLLEGARRLDEAENITIDVDSPKELQDKEKQPMATKRKSDLLAEALQTLIEESADIDGAAVVGVDGLVYSANVPNRSMDEDMVGAAAAAVMGLSRRSVQQLKRGDFARTLIQGDDGNIIVAGLNADTFLVSLTPKAVNLGMAFAEVRDITKRLQEIL